MENNAFFKTSDAAMQRVDGFDIPAGWWSRPWEYAFALRFAQPRFVVADMGTGWTYRPLRYELARRCAFIYAQDTDHRVLEQPAPVNMRIVTGNFSDRVDIDADSLDIVYCISVLEDCGTGIRGALREFGRLVKPDGRIVLTMDSQYDAGQPLGQYPGVNIDIFLSDVQAAGLVFDGSVNLDKSGALNHADWNLACFHCVLRRE